MDIKKGLNSRAGREYRKSFCPVLAPRQEPLSWRPLRALSSRSPSQEPWWANFQRSQPSSPVVLSTPPFLYEEQTSKSVHPCQLPQGLSCWHLICFFFAFFWLSLLEIKFHPSASPRAMPSSFDTNSWIHEYKITAHVISLPCTSSSCTEVVKFQAEATVG